MKKERSKTLVPNNLAFMKAMQIARQNVIGSGTVSRHGTHDIGNQPSDFNESQHLEIRSRGG